MPNSTANLGLTKPLGTENYSVDHMNGNSDRVDAFVGKLTKDFLPGKVLGGVPSINADNTKISVTAIEGFPGGVWKSTSVTTVVGPFGASKATVRVFFKKDGTFGFTTDGTAIADSIEICSCSTNVSQIVSGLIDKRPIPVEARMPGVMTINNTAPTAPNNKDLWIDTSV